jgi:hypothetical protein
LINPEKFYSIIYKVCIVQIKPAKARLVIASAKCLAATTEIPEKPMNSTANQGKSIRL